MARSRRATESTRVAPCLERHRRPRRSLSNTRLRRRSWVYSPAMRATTPFHPYPAVKKVLRNYRIWRVLLLRGSICEVRPSFWSRLRHSIGRMLRKLRAL